MGQQSYSSSQERPSLQEYPTVSDMPLSLVVLCTVTCIIMHAMVALSSGSSMLPPMEPRVLAGHAPQLVMTTSARNQAAQFSSGQACNSYPSMRHKLNVKTHSTSNM